MIKKHILVLIIYALFTAVVYSGCAAGKVTEALLDGNEQQSGHQAGNTDNGRYGVVTEEVADVYKEADLQSERVTQAIFNQQVAILDIKDNWSKVKVEDGYTGWVRSKYIDADYSSIDTSNYKYKIVVTSKVKEIYSDRTNRIVIRDAVMGTELYSKKKVADWYEVALPEKRTGWVNQSGIMQINPGEEIPKTSVEEFIATATRFKGTIYLWGGISAGGLDCSGLTYICARINGVGIPRDADKQYLTGTKVEIGSIKEGDLVFFSTDDSLKDISHVGIYIGNNQFIHASKSKGAVIIGSLEDEYFKKRFSGVRRII